MKFTTLKLFVDLDNVVLVYTNPDAITLLVYCILSSSMCILRPREFPDTMSCITWNARLKNAQGCRRIESKSEQLGSLGVKHSVAIVTRTTYYQIRLRGP